MKKIWQKDGVNWIDDNWFVAQITDVGTTPSPGNCLGQPYGWQAVDYCPNGQATNLIGTPSIYGTLTLRPAYNITGSTTNDGDLVIMRLRGTFNGQQIYEFFVGGGSGGGGNLPYVTVQIVTDVQCYNGQLLVTRQCLAIPGAYFVPNNSCFPTTTPVPSTTTSTTTTFSPTTSSSTTPP